MLDDPRYTTYAGRRMLRVAGGETPPADAPGNPPPPAAEPAKPEPERKLTQAEVDRVVNDRLARQRHQFADYDELKAKAGKYDEVEAQSKSDLERAQEALRTAEETASKATERANATARRAAIVSEAHQAGAVDPDAVVALLPKDAVTVGDDGQVTGAKDAVAALLEQKTYLVGERQPGPGDGGARTTPPEPSIDDRIRVAREAGDTQTAVRLELQRASQTG
jgi:hypothetical protein